jgi:hypothetical protein
MPRPAVDPTHSPVLWVNRWGREAYHQHQNNAEIKNECSYTLSSPYRPSWRVQGKLHPFCCHVYPAEFILLDKKMGPVIRVALTADRTPTIMSCKAPRVISQVLSDDWYLLF